MQVAFRETSHPQWKRCIRASLVLMLILFGSGGLVPEAEAQAPTELFISEYVEGSSFNKAVELYNGTGAAVDLGLGDYELVIYFNGNTSAGTTVDLVGVVANGDVFVVADDGADPAILAQTDQTSTSSFFNGDDAVVLSKAGVVVDSLGQVGFDPGSEWGAGLTSTQDNTLRRKSSVCDGDTAESDAFDPATEWDGYANNTFDGLGSHSASCTGEPPGAARPLLLTELVVTPTAGEFIEIYNPGASPVDLASYYLTDATFAGGGVFYYNIVTGANAGGGGFSDFHARFPAGAAIAPGEYQTISLPGSDDFFATYGTNPTYELYEDGASADAIPDMEEALPGSINGQGGLTNSGEVVVLYYWDGATDLVTDVDYGLWGDKDEAVDKTGVSIDGPDGDSDASTYLPDTAISTQDVILGAGHSSGDAFQRLDLSEGTETQAGGNGVEGNDETSENLSVTWVSDEAPTPGSPTPTGWIINEIHADPASDSSCPTFGLPEGCGDANGDGVQDFSDDEFVEIANTTGGPVDISGWTLSDGFGVRHVFPGRTIIADGCVAVVFGGGPLVGVFGGAVVQEASSGALGLNNGGDTVTLRDTSANLMASDTYGSEGGDNQSLTRDPDITGAFVKHTTVVSGVLFSPGTLADGTLFSGCTPPPVLEIWEVQGDGLASPFEGFLVNTDDNVVTCLGTDGFFMQTPTARTDNNVDTSDGVFVYTGSAPTVVVGDLVDVVGRVNEFFGFTEISSVAELKVEGLGSVPAPVMFNEAVPSPSPLAPSCAIEYECYEGMYIEIMDGRVTGPNQRFGTDPVAEVHITAASTRTFREPGILFPGLTGLPVWDGNPEVFELDPDKLGLPNQIIPAGSSFSARGALGYEFGGYELWPNELTYVPAEIPWAVRERVAGEFTVGSLNMFRFFNDVDDDSPPDAQGQPRDDFVVSTAEYQRRTTKFVDYILNVLDAPDVLAVQEVESLGVLEDLAVAIALVDPTVIYTPILVEGNDIGTIDVGFMVRDTVTVERFEQLGYDETYDNPVAMTEDILHDRPPLLVEGRFELEFGSFPIAVMTVHNRSLSSIEDPVQGLRVRQKRYEQAVSIAEKVQALQEANPEVHLVVIGDFNGFEFTDGYVDPVGQIVGDFVPSDNLVCDPSTGNACEDLVNPDLTNQTEELEASERYSFTFRGNAQTLDHALTAGGLESFLAGLELGRGNADAAVDLINDDGTVLRSSDHDGLVLFAAVDEDGDGVPDPVDVCPGTVIPESVPTKRLGVNRYALVDEDGIFDTSQMGQGGPNRDFTVGDTGGCSCEQIIEAQHLGKGHEKFGCSLGAMRNWVKLVNP